MLKPVKSIEKAFVPRILGDLICGFIYIFLQLAYLAEYIFDFSHYGIFRVKAVSLFQVPYSGAGRYEYLPLIGPQLACDHIEKSSLSGSVSAYEAYSVAAVYMKVHTFYYDVGSVYLCKIACR